MKKYLLPTALILALATVGAIAQTTFRAIQLSQDTTGQFAVDTNFGVYFTGHLLNTGASIPAPTITGTGSPTVSGTDVAGLITMGASATTATVVFGQAYLAVPNCVVTWQTIGGIVSPIAYVPATTSIALTQGTTSSNKVNYFCTGSK